MASHELAMTPFAQQSTSDQLRQVWTIVALLMVTQYTVQALVYYGHLGEFFKSRAFLLNGILPVALALYYGGIRAAKALVAPYLRVPTSVFWVLFAVLWNFPLIIATMPLNDILYANTPTLVRPIWFGFPKVAESALLFAAIAICDELFWIGFVLPRLLASGYSYQKASLVIGALWGVGYVPLIFTGFLVSLGLTPASVILGFMAMAPIYIWLYAKTSNALLVVIMCVSMQFSNWTVPVLPEPPLFDNGPVSMLNLLTFIAGLLLWRCFPPSDRAASQHVGG